MTGTRVLVAVIGLMLAPVVVGKVENVQPLQRNPFKAPAVLEPQPAFAAPERVPEPEPQPAPEPQFSLRAVLAAGKRSLANIDGNILGVGAEIEGYRLVSISEEQVVLKHRRKRIVLTIYDDDAAAGRN